MSQRDTCRRFGVETALNSSIDLSVYAIEGLVINWRLDLSENNKPRERCPEPSFIACLGSTT